MDERIDKSTHEYLLELKDAEMKLKSHGRPWS
jgi:hypothetical protein